MNNVRYGESNQMESGEIYFQNAVSKFEDCLYDEAVSLFVKAYDVGVHQDEIVEIIYSCFITPNEEEFKQTYESTAKGVTDFAYEETRIDFIPVAEEHFYLFDRLERKFCGDFWVGNLEKRKKRFHSVLISNVDDMKTIAEKFNENEYATIYFLLQENKDIFYSFYKLPGFFEIYLKNAIIFNDEEQMKTYFMENTDVYLPITVMGKSCEYYYEILNDISNDRKACMDKERNNVFLSICIPSYNRGDILLENVKRVLNLPYDSEIEVVISNNGSTENVEGYYEIKKMQDSRIKYVEFEENQGYASNVLNVLSHASGKFAIMASDEDVMILEKVQDLLELLYQNMDTGVIEVTGYGGNFLHPEEITDTLLDAGVYAVERGMNNNYLTGIAYNMDIIKKDKILEHIQMYRGNVFVEYYVHMALCMFMGKKSDLFVSSIPVWYAGEVFAPEEDSDREEILLSYMTLESRLEQFEGVVDFIGQLYEKDTQEYMYLFYSSLEHTYRMLTLAKVWRSKAFEREYIWEDVCAEVYRYSMCLAKENQIDHIVGGLIDKLYMVNLVK